MRELFTLESVHNIKIKEWTINHWAEISITFLSFPKHKTEMAKFKLTFGSSV